MIRRHGNIVNEYFWNLPGIGAFLCKGLFTLSRLLNAMISKTPRNHRTEPSRLEAAAAVDQEISRIEDAIRKLKIDFDIYFAGAVKRPPLEARARLEANLKRLMDNRGLSYSQRYLMNTLIARFTSYRELWRRTMRARGEDVF